MKKLIIAMSCVMLLAVGANATLISNGDFEANTSNWASKNGQHPIDWFSSLAVISTNGNYGEAITGYGNGKVAALKGMTGNYYQQVLTGVDAGTTKSYVVDYDGGIRYHSSYPSAARDFTLRVSLWDTTADVELSGVDVVTAYSNAATSLDARTHVLSYDNAGLAGHKLAIRFTNNTVRGSFSENETTILFDNVTVTVLNASILVLPAPNGDINVALDTVLEWAPAFAEPLGYDVFLSTEPNSAFVQILNNQLQTTVDPVLLNATTYYWSVVTYEPNAITQIPNKIAGPIWSFTTVPAIPVLLTSPEGQLVWAGDEAVFEVTGLNQTDYSWYKSVDESNITPEDDTLISTVGSILVLSGAETQASEEGFVYCRLMNSIGSVDSDVASLMTRRDVAKWELEGDLFDSVGTNDGICVFPTYVADGVVGAQSLEVTPGDPNTIISVPNAIELNPSNFTVEAWVKPASFSSYAAIVSNRGKDLESETPIVRGGYVIYVHGSGRIGLWLHDGSSWGQLTSNTSSVVTLGQWNHVVATFEDGVSTIYVNGVQGGQASNQVLMRNDTTQFYIGAGANDELTPDFYFDGLLDQVTISSYAIDGYTVARNYVTQFPDVDICVDQAGLTYDFDGDCDVDIADFAMFATEWLNCNRVAGTTSTLDNCN